jgi:hypothetical protein
VAADAFSGRGQVTGDVLRNDFGATAVVRNTSPSNGTVTVSTDGTVTYTPKAGFTGTDTFTYTATNAVQLFTDASASGSPLPPLTTVPGPGGTTTRISGEGFGSSLAPVPGRPGFFYGPDRSRPQRRRPGRQQVGDGAELRARDRRVQARQREGRAA